MNWFNKYKLEVLLGIMILSYVILFSYLSIHRLYSLNSHYYDLGIMNQTVYNTSKGFFLEMTNPDLQKNLSRLAIHFDPILAFIAPLYWFYPGPEVLLVVQTLVLASGALVIFLVGNKILKDKLMSLVFAISYLLFFQVERANLFDFHAVVLATGFLLWMIYFSLKKKWIPTLIFILLALLTKEHVGLIVFLYSIYLFFIRKDKKISLVIGSLGALFFLLTTFVIIPYFRGNEHFALKYYSNFTEIKLDQTIDYLTRILLPNLPYIFFAPLEFLIGLPEIIINILSSSSNMKSYYFHYSSLVIPFIFFSAISGAAKIQKLKLRYFILFLFTVLSLNSIYKYNPLPLKFLKEPYYLLKLNKKKINSINKWKKLLINDKIKVSTTPKLAPFFTSRRYFYNYDATYGYANIQKDEIIKAIDNYTLADYVIINKEEIGNLNNNSIPTLFYNKLIKNKKFKLIFNQDGIEVFKKYDFNNNTIL